MKNDINLKRVAAFSKRVLQVCLVNSYISASVVIIACSTFVSAWNFLCPGQDCNGSEIY